MPAMGYWTMTTRLLVNGTSSIHRESRDSLARTCGSWTLAIMTTAEHLRCCFRPMGITREAIGCSIATSLVVQSLNSAITRQVVGVARRKGEEWCAREDSNFWPTASEAAALSR